jgi:hypothetical protein
LVGKIVGLGVGAELGEVVGWFEGISVDFNEGNAEG